MENMRKLVFLCQMSMVGTDAWNFVEVPVEFTSDQIDTLGQEFANDNASMYGFYSYPSEDLEDGEEDSCYDDNIGCTWYDYDAEKHDTYTINGIPDWRKNYC